MLPVSGGYSPHWSVNMPLRWRHNHHDGVSNHQPHGCLLNRLFRRRSKCFNLMTSSCTSGTTIMANYWRLCYHIEAERKWPTFEERIFANTFSSMEIVAFWLKFHLNMFTRVKFTIIHHLFRKCFGAEQETSHYLNQWGPSLVTHICVSRTQWVILQQRSLQNACRRCVAYIPAIVIFEYFAVAASDSMHKL